MAHLDRYADGPLALLIQTEEGNGAVLVAEGGPAHVENILQSFQIDGAVDAQVFTCALGYVASQLHVHGDGPVLHRGIDP